MAGGGAELYLSFDCATKSFAYALLRVASAPKNEQFLSELFERQAATTGPLFELAAGGACDLTPGRPDRSVSTVERVRAVQRYLRDEVYPQLSHVGHTPASPALKVAVEFQMGVNAHSRVVATTLVAAFCDANVFFVGPSLKNRLKVLSRPDLDHHHFLEKYQTTYAANKAHAAALYFDCIAPAFGHDVKKIPKKFHKDFADSVLQVLGFLCFAGSEKNAETRF